MARGAALALAAAAGPALAQAPAARRPAAKLAPRLRIVIPANAGGGWDQTGRALGAALVAAGGCDAVDFENIGGKGGTLGLAKYAERDGADPNALLMGGFVMVGAVALAKPAVDFRHITPVARLTSDYLVVTVPANSSLRTARDLSAAMRANLAALPIAGGSAGGVDHMFAGVLARAAKGRPEQLAYQPYAGGNEVVEALVSGRAAVGISGYSEFADAIAAGKLRAIGVSARRPAFGLPSFREQGLDADMANWRGVFTGKGVAPARVAELAAGIEAATLQDSWLRTLKANRWDAAWMSGKDFNEFLELDLATAGVMSYLLKLKT